MSWSAFHANVVAFGCVATVVVVVVVGGGGGVIVVAVVAVVAVVTVDVVTVAVVAVAVVAVAVAVGQLPLSVVDAIVALAQQPQQKLVCFKGSGC